MKNPCLMLVSLLLLGACASEGLLSACHDVRSEALRAQMSCPSLMDSEPEQYYQYCLSSCPDDDIHTDQCRARCEQWRDGKQDKSS